MPTLLYAMQLLEALPGLIAAGQNVHLLITQANVALKSMVDENRNPTDEEWNVLNQHIKLLRAELHAGEQE